MQTRRSFALATMLAAAMLPAMAQNDYPNRPIRFILPYAAGGVTTSLMHLLGQKMTENWGQPVIVDNRPGANTVIGTEILAKAPPDGYTILMTTSGHVILPHSMRNLPFDTIRDFAPVATVTSSQYTLVVNPKLPANNLKEFIELAKTKPGGINFGSGGSGGPSHLAGEQFNAMTGTRLMHIPYSKGSGAVLTDLIGGQIDAYFSPPSIVAHTKAGRLKAIAISGDARSPALPDVPTFTEQGLPNFDIKVWFGVLAPAGTPKPIIDKLAGEFRRILALPDVREKIIAMELDPSYAGPEQFGAMMRADKERYTKIIDNAGIKIAN